MQTSEYQAKKILETLAGEDLYLAMLLAVPLEGKQGWGASELEEVAYTGYARLHMKTVGTSWLAPTYSAGKATMLSKVIEQFAGVPAATTVKVKALALFDASALKTGNLRYSVASTFELTEVVTPAEAAAEALKLTQE